MEDLELACDDISAPINSICHSNPPHPPRQRLPYPHLGPDDSTFPAPAHDQKVFFRQAREQSYLSINAGCFRLLLPSSLESALADMHLAKQVIVSRGPWPAARRRDAIEVLFDDATDEPYALHFGVEQIDRLPLDADAGKPCKFAVYTLGPKLACYWSNARYRRSARLPDLSP
jgi:hypothetical protein